MIDVITSAALKTIGNDIQAAIDSVAAKHGVTITYNGGKYSNGADGTVHMKVVSNSTAAQTAMKTKFGQSCGWYGISPDAYGKTFVYKYDTYTVVGINNNAPKYPIQCEGPDGRITRFPSPMVSKHFPAIRS